MEIIRNDMKRKIRRAVLIETEQISFLVNRSSTDFMICKKCGEDAVMLSPEKLSEGTDIHKREIYRRVECGTVHYQERENGDVFICIQDLLNQ